MTRGSKPNALELEKTICALESLGRLLTTVSLAEDTEIELDCLADLGRVISQQAMKALDYVLESEPRVTAVSDRNP